MDLVFSKITTAFFTMSVLEIFAVIFAVIYLLLAIKENIWCWFFGFLSTAIYLIIFWKVSLFSESFLQIFYLAMSIYGWMQWSNINQQSESLHSDKTLKNIQEWSISIHLKVIILTSVLAIILGFIMSHYTSAAFPYIDAATSLFAVVATYMVTQKIIENWFYWIVIDSVSIYLYVNRELYLTALLFLLYVGLCFAGYFSWRVHLQEQVEL